ncbi:MAG TPA: putative metalloprotease CJM1_0395 family protein [Sandaracinaceae bacterium LLY-WYZ-13_1]|nr:putative metalloprotease CJM1_0395 family protein [Sandaracinaceae bacterium LLY-WYZ-13_1]
MLPALSPPTVSSHRLPGGPSAARALDAPVPSARVDADVGRGPPADPRRVSPRAPIGGSGDALSAEEQREVERLKARDAEVRAHEQAHAAAGGAHAGAPSYRYERGPDGERYAVSGEVSIDTGEIEGDTEASLQKLQQVARAALAPAQPSGQDRRVAARAQARIARLRAEMVEERSAGEASGPDGAAARAAGAYARAAAPEAPAPRLSLTSCGSCGGVHGG